MKKFLLKLIEDIRALSPRQAALVVCVLAISSIAAWMLVRYFRRNDIKEVA